MRLCKIGRIWKVCVGPTHLELLGSVLIPRFVYFTVTVQQNPKPTGVQAIVYLYQLS
jgi:hypothetical protein